LSLTILQPWLRPLRLGSKESAADECSSSVSSSGGPHRGGAVKSPGPTSLPYSPECVEGWFHALRVV
jgi:hypothetical protein